MSAATRTTDRSRRLAAAVLTGAVLGLAACGSDSRTVEDTDPDPEVYPAVAASQASVVLDAVDGALERGGRAGTAQAYGVRIATPYRDIALARAKVNKARGADPAVPPRVERLRLLLPSGQNWPRFFVAVGTPSGAPAPVLRVLVSANARAPYALHSELTLLPGAKVPTVSETASRATALAPSAAGLAAPPGPVAARFATVLTQGAKSADAALFAPNPYSDQLFTRLATDRKALAKVATVSSTHTADPKNLYAVRTADGGALVIATLRQSYTITVKQGTGTVRVDPELAALSGKSQFGKALTRTSAEVIAFAVPPAGKGRVTVIAAVKGDVAASAT